MKSMNINRTRYLLVALTLLVGCVTVFVSTTPAQDIHVLIVADDGHPKTGHLHRINKDKIEALMKRIIARMLEKEKPGATVKISELLYRQVTRENIFGWIQSLNPGTDDVVFVYFSGHGGADKEGTHEHFLNLYGEKINRKELAKAVEELNCRLKILITDASGYSPVIPIELPPRGNPDYSHLDDLFLEHEGFLNLTSASPGQLSIGDRVNGGYFTLALVDGILPWSMADIDRNPQDGFVSWEEVFEETKVLLDNCYEMAESKFSRRFKMVLRRRNQTIQTPEVLSEFPKRIPQESPLNHGK